MKSMRCFGVLVFTLVFFLFSLAPVYADTKYVTAGYVKGTQADRSYLDEHGFLYAYQSQPVPFKSIKVSWKVLEGDAIYIDWTNVDGSFIGHTPINTVGQLEGSATIYPPSGNCYQSIIGINTLFSTSDGTRIFWYNIAENMNGDKTIFSDPNTSDYVPPPKPEATNRDIVDAIENQTGELGNQLGEIAGNLESQLGQVSSGLSNVSNGINQVNNKLNEVNSNLVEMKNHLNNISSQLYTISNQLNTMQNTLNSIDNNLRQLKDYIMTPRQADPIHTNGLNPVPYFDPTPPPIDDPAPAPYVYDKPIPEMPGMIDSPGPLPRNPDPMAMEHDDPLSKDEPVNLEEPYESDDPYTKDSPLSPEEPLQRQDPNMDTPLPVDPFNMDTPLPMDGFNPEQPITREEPLAPSGGYTPDAPLLPEAPITPQNPVGP